MYDFVKDAENPLQAGVTVGSRNFKKAVQRNRVKRIMREAYRLNKLPLQEALGEQGISLVLFFIYIGKELPLFEDVHQKMRVLLQRLTNHILKKPAKD